MPETKNRTIEDISRTWRTGNAVENNDKTQLNLENGVGTSKMFMYEQRVDISTENH